MNQEKKRTLPLVEQLILQANMALDKNQYEQAISLAERGLRVDRREPRFYLVLAEAYDLLNKAQQANFFAQQGLRYTGKSDEISLKLRLYLK